MTTLLSPAGQTAAEDVLVAADELGEPVDGNATLLEVELDTRGLTVLMLSRIVVELEVVVVVVVVASGMIEGKVSKFV